jgi:hypothetical protein
MLTVVVITLLGACGRTGAPSGGDPGNRRLHALASDPVLQALPPDARADGAPTLTPARYMAPGFDGGGWDGPAVTLRFESLEPAQSVFAFYVEHARASGWAATSNRNVLGYPEVWTKSVSGSRAHLTLTDLDIRATSGGTLSRYVLNEST